MESIHYRFLDEGAAIEVISGVEDRPTRCVAMLRSGLPLDIVSYTDRLPSGVAVRGLSIAEPWLVELPQ